MFSIRQKLRPTVAPVAWGENREGSGLSARGRYPQDRRVCRAGDDHAIGIPACSAQDDGKVRDVLRRSALNIHLFQFAADGENDPSAIVGPGRGRPHAFRTGQRADIDAIERAYVVVPHAVLADSGEYHPAAVGGDCHRRL